MPAIWGLISSSPTHRPRPSKAGQLKFQTHGEWSAPFNSPGTAGYTEFHETGAANIGHIEFNDSDNSVTVDIDSIDPESTIEIHYGAYTGTDDGSGAVAPTSATTSSAFSISVKGGDATTNQLKAIRTLKNAPIAVRVYSQASGGGNVSASTSDNKGDVGAGSTDREVTVVYTAAGANKRRQSETDHSRWLVPPDSG